jgi:hypothetical protein
MTFSHRVALAFLMVGILSAPRAWAQSATAPAPAAMPAAVKSAAVTGPAEEAQIRKFIVDHVIALNAPEPAAVPKSRDALIGEAGGGGATPAYQAKYAEVLNAEIIKFLANTNVPRARLNAAIVVARVADIVKNTKLEKAVLELLGQKQPEHLKLWGMRASKSVLPELVKVKGEKPLATAVLATVKSFPASGEIAQDAYEALNPRNVSAKDVPTVVGPLLDLLEWRISIYSNGVPDDPKAMVPDSPVADATAFTNVFNATVWENVAKPQQVKAMQLACHLFKHSAQRGDDRQFAGYREQLKDTIKTTSAALFVAASVMGEQVVAADAKRVSTTIGGANVSMVGVVDPLCQLIPAMKGFEQVKPLAPQAPLAPQNPPAQSPPAQPAAAGAGNGAGNGPGADASRK